MLYFSYGSFLDSETLKKHCPSAKFVSRAILPNFEAQFNYMSKTYNAGVTGVEFAPGRIARGVVYEIPLKEMERLDVVEAVPQGFYYRQTVVVIDEKGKLLRAETYRTTNPGGPFKSSRRYVGLMLKGAREHEMDSEYIKSLEELLSTLEH